ncbi:MAG: LamG domain-containing protein, partial [Nanoarchaeota archaeon]|nr:LamG domain-containing protein [Nanoarchaeota archaeon]
EESEETETEENNEEQPAEDEETETEENNEEQPVEDEETETEETPEEPVEDEEPSDDDSEESESPVTGEAVSETSYTVDGEVSNENDFTYNLELGKKARIVSGTITVNDKPIEDSEISLKTKDNKAIVSTNYAIEEKGFGQEYLGEEIALTFKIRVEDLEFKASSGDLEIKLIYHNHEIASYSELVPVSKKIPLIANQTNKTEQNETKIPTITLLKEIPLIRIPFTQNTTLNLEEYFQGADSYKTKIGDITATFEGHILTLTPDPEFKGARKAKILALTDEQSLESNEFLILVSSGAVQIKTSREQIRVGQPVKWKKEVSKENPGEDISIEVPKDAEKLNVKKLDKKGEVIEEETITGNSLFTGNVVIEVDLGKRKPSIIKTSLNKFNTWLANLKAELSKKLGVTGKVVENPVAEQAEEVVDIILESDSAEEVEGYIIEYETEAPTSEEILTKNGKQITITGPDEILYENVIAFTTLNNNVPVSSAKKIKLYWYNYEYDQLSKEEIVQATTTQVSEVPKEEVVEEISIGKKIATQNNKTNSTNTAVTKSSILTESSPSSTESKTIGQDYVKQETVFDFYDLDFDGFIDYIEWVVPHLSNQTYEIIIEITNAEHLDENKTFISNIYQEVSALDGNWSKIIPSTHYVRVTFEKNLTSSNDITLYPRTITGTPKIEIYEINGSELIAEFSSLIDNQYNKVYLTNLQGSQDTFDLLVLNGEIQIDHIIDPVDTTPPDIDFGTETPSDGSSQSNTNIFVDLDSSDASDHYAFADFDSDLFLWLRMDDTNTTNNPTDLSSYSNNGTLVGNALINSSSGYFGNGSYLDGDGDYIEVPGLDNSFNSSFTVLGWIKTGDDTSNPIIISDYYLNSGGIPTKYYGWKLLVSSSKLTATIGDESTEASTSFDATTINDSVWHHFAAVFPSGGGLPTLYVDGSSETPPVGSTFINPHSLRKFRIADQRLFTGSDNQIDAMMDEILVFNRTLTSAEISALYNASANQYENNFTSLSVGSHTFTGYAVDIAGNKNQTEQRTVTIDATLPTVTIISPSNNSNFNTSSVDFNVSLNENTSWCGLSISGAANQTMMINASGTGANYTNSSIADGSY